MFLLGLELVAFGVGVPACSYLWAIIIRDSVDEEVNEWLSEKCEKTRVQALVLKSEFQGAEVTPQRVMDNHTHGVSAADRSTASLLIQRVARGAGREAFYFQGSGSDARSGRMYSRKYFWAKDLMAPHSKLEPDRNDVIAMVDVDYYVDMEEMMFDTFQPYMLYSLVPSRAAKDSGDYGYCFDKAGQVVYHVSGGGSYSHAIWDWDGDSVRVFRKVMGVTLGVACYAIERRQMDADHQVILLIPLFRTRNPVMSWLVRDKVEARTLRKFNPVVGNFIRFYTSGPEGFEVTTGKPGEYCSNVVPASVDSIVASAGSTMSGKLTLATVKSKLKDGGQDEGKYLKAAEVLLEFHSQRLPTNMRVSLVDAVRRFQWVPKGEQPDEDAKPGMTAFMRPVLHGGFVPDVCAGNEERFVEKRVKEIASKELPMDSFMLKCMDEFAALVVPDGEIGALMPVDVEEVYERQSKPSQRAILREAEHGCAESVTKQFMKREAYGRVNDPRGISTINGVDKREYSRFMYAFADNIMKRLPWYAFGKSPREVAERVAEVAEAAQETLHMTDFSRMDGRHSNVLGYLEKRVLLRAFAAEYHVQLMETWNRHHHLAAKTVFGIKYKTEWQRLSGGADTSAANTLDTGFIAYYTYRMMGHGAKEAWGKLGIYGGDDGLSADMHPTTAKRAASRVGQVLDLETVKHGGAGVAFLARRYGPDVWFGDTNSCCDIKRQLAKFHLTVNLPSKVTPVQKLQEKSLSFFLTDKHTPLIGELVRKVLKLFPLPKDKFKNELRIWGVELDDSKQYPNATANWMDDIVSAELQDFDVPRFRTWLRSADSTSVFDPPRVADPLPPNPQPGTVTLDGDLLVVPDEQAGDGGETPRIAAEADGKPHFRPRKPKAERPSHQVKKPARNPTLASSHRAKTNTIPSKAPAT